MAMDYRKVEGGPLFREFFESKEALDYRKAEIEEGGGKVERVVSVASVRREIHEDHSKYPAHQGKREVERRLKQLTAAQAKCTSPCEAA